MGNAENVKTPYPSAICEPFYNGPGEPVGYEVFSSQGGVTLGEGHTRILAREDASNKLSAT